MTKSELILRLAERYPGLYKTELERTVNIIFDEITSALARGDRIELRDFGAFSIKTREARIGRNPRSGDRVSIPAKVSAAFKTGRKLRMKLNGGETEESRE